MLIASGTEMLRICAHREQYRNLMASILEIQITISADAQQQYKKKTPKHVSVRCNDFFACGSVEVIDVDSLFEKAKHVGHLCLSDDTYVHDVRTEGGTVHRK